MIHNLTKSLLDEVIACALATGADYAEVFVEHTRNNSVYMIGGKVESVADGIVSGASVRAFMGLRCVSSSTTDVTRSGLLACAAKVRDVIAEGKAALTVNLTPMAVNDIHKITLVPADHTKAEKVELIRRGVNSAKEYSDKITQVSGSILDVDHNILIASSDGFIKEDRQIRTRMAISAIAANGTDMQSGFCGPGRKMGLEVFDLFPPEEIGKEAARSACVNLSADYCKAGKMTVAIDNGFGGVIFHEACGHSLEATCVARGASQMCGKLGQQIANVKVTAVDDGTIPNAWGSINIDDEGTPSQRNVLIENGILKSYMIDKFNARRMGMAPTGSSRRQSYAYDPTSRMTNTFIENGNDKNEDIIASIEYGLYCAKMGGGSVNPINGAFNFAVDEGYIVREGKICEPVRGASLIGTGSDILMNIDMVGQNLSCGQGMCGSSSGSIPTDVGQPLIRVKEITVGGR